MANSPTSNEFRINVPVEKQKEKPYRHRFQHPTTRSEKAIFDSLEQEGVKTSELKAGQGIDYVSDVAPEETDQEDFIASKNYRSPGFKGSVYESDLSKASHAFDRKTGAIKASDPEAQYLEKEDAESAKKAINFDVHRFRGGELPFSLPTLEGIWNHDDVQVTLTLDRYSSHDTYTFKRRGEKQDVQIPRQFIDQITNKGEDAQSWRLVRPTTQGRLDEDKLEDLEKQLGNLRLDDKPLGQGEVNLNLVDKRFDYSVNLDKIRFETDENAIANFLRVWESEDIQSLKLITSGESITGIKIAAENGPEIFVSMNALARALGFEFQSKPSDRSPIPNLTRISIGPEEDPITITAKADSALLRQFFSKLKIDGVRRADIATQKDHRYSVDVQRVNMDLTYNPRRIETGRYDGVFFRKEDQETERQLIEKAVDMLKNQKIDTIKFIIDQDQNLFSLMVWPEGNMPVFVPIVPLAQALGFNYERPRVPNQFVKGTNAEGKEQTFTISRVLALLLPDGSKINYKTTDAQLAQMLSELTIEGQKIQPGRDFKATIEELPVNKISSERPNVRPNRPRRTPQRPASQPRASV